jgi:EH domain-containing protein 1
MEISSGAIGSCSKDQKTMYQEWFHYADSGHYNLFLPLFSSPSLFLLLSMIIIIIIFFFKDGDGRITGNDATKFFSLSKLSRQDLKPVRSFIS